MGATGVWLARLRGLAVVGGFVVAGVALAGPLPAGYLHGSIYPWWTWALVAAGAVAGMVLTVAPDSARGALLRAAAAGVALVVGAELVGTGVVARKHWHPASGIASYGAGQLPEVERLAVQIAVAAGVATLAAAWQLLATRDLGLLHRSSAWRAQVAFGVALLALLPVALAASEVGGPRLTTWGAAGLVYAGPWGVAVVASAWTSRPAAAALLETVLVCAGLAALGPQMVDVFAPSAEAWFVGVAPAVLVLIMLVVTRLDARVDQPVGS